MPFLRARTALIIAVIALAAVLIAAGFRPDGLPFQPGATYSDAATSHWPAALFLHDTFLADDGTFTLWRETFMAGAPFMANPLNKTAYPLQWFALLLPPLPHLNTMIVLHLLLAGAGMWGWSRSLGLGEAGALIAALAYMLAPRWLAQLGAGHLDLLYAVAWWPCLMWSAGRLGERGGGRFALLTSLSTGMLITADVRLALYALPCAAVMFGVRWVQNGRRWRRLFTGFMSATLAAGLALGLVVPVVAWSPWLTRSALTPAEAGVYSLPPGQLLTLLLPPPAGGDQETVVYLGLVTLTLAAIGAFALPRRWRVALAGALVLVALFALGTNGVLWPLLASAGGLLTWFRVPARSWFVAVLLSAPLAGLGVETLLRGLAGFRQRARAMRWARLGAFGLLVMSATLGLLMLLAVPGAALSGIQALVVGGGLGAALLLALAGRLGGQRLFGVLVGLLIVDSALSARGWIEWRVLDDVLEPTRELAAALVADDAARVYSPDYSLPQEAVAAAGLRLFGGVDPFQIAGVSVGIMRAGGIEHEGYSIVMPPLREDELETGFNRDAVIDAELMASWDVSHIVARYPIEHPDLEPLGVFDGVYAYRNRLHVPVESDGFIPDWGGDWGGDDWTLPGRLTVGNTEEDTGFSWLGAMCLFGVVNLSLGVIALRSRRRAVRA